jgi:hypothetical protein
MEINTDEINAAREAGFTDQEIKNSYADELNAAKAAGFTDQEINKQFNFQPVDDGLFKSLFETAKKRVEERRATKEAVQTAVVGENFDGDYILSEIFGTNLYNLSYRAATGKGTPDALNIPQPKDYTWTEEFLATAGKLAIESPLYGISAIPGVVLGSLGGPMGVTGGASFTGAAIPTATRSLLVEVLKNQDEQKPSDVVKILLEKSLIQGTKEGLKFSASMLAPMAKIPGVGVLSENYLTRVAAQIVGYEGTGIALDRELPSGREFALNSTFLALLGIKLPGKVARDKAETTFVETGKTPTDVTMDGMKDRTIVEDISSIDIKTPRAYKELKDKEVIDLKPIEVKVEKIEKFEDPIANKAAENISFESTKNPLTVEQIKNTLKNSKRKFIIEVIDQKYPVLEALREAGIKTKTGIEKLNPYESIRIQEGMSGRGNYFIEHKTLDFKTLADKGPGLVDIVEPMAGVSKKELQLFSSFLLNRHALTLAKRGKETGIDINNAKIFVEKYSTRETFNKRTNEKSTFEARAKLVDQFHKDVLEYARDAGRLSEDAYSAYLELNKNYVPLARDLPKPGKTGFVKEASNPFKRLKGSKEKIIDPLETILKNTDFIIRSSELNKTKSEFIDIILESKKRDPKLFPDIVKKKSNLKPINILRKELENILDKDQVAKLSDNAVNHLTIFRQEAVYPDATSISFRKDGKYQVWEVGKDLADAFRVMDNQSINIYQKFMQAPAKLLRTGAIIDPDFAIPNFLRDTANATFLSKVNFIPFKDSLQGLFYIVYKGNSEKASEAYKRYLKGGGMNSVLRSIDRSIYDSDVHKILSQGRIRNEYKTILGPLKALTDISESMTRVGLNEKVYQAAKKKGLSERDAIERATFEQRNLLDYQKQGTLGVTLNRYTSFWNSRVQATVNIVEALRDRPGRASIALFFTAILPSIGFYIYNMDDKDYKEIPEFIKQNKWYAKVNGVGRFYPKGYDIQAFVSSLIEKTLDTIRTDDPKAFNEFAKDFLMQNVKQYNPIPIVWKPHIENLFNYSFFRDGPILPPNAPKDMKNQYYSTEYTNQLIKKLAENLTELVGVDNYFANPIYLENIYDAYTAGLGAKVKDALTYISINFGIIDDPIKPSDDLSKIPGVRAFEAKDIYGNSASVQKFYRRVEEYKKDFNTIQYLKQTGNYEALSKEYKKYNFDIQAVMDQEKQVKEAGDGIKVIYNAKTKGDGTLWTPEKKQEMIEDLYKARIAAAQRGLKILGMLEENKKNKKNNKK